MKTEKYIITVGTNEGYENNSGAMPMSEFGEIANKLALKLYAKAGVYPSFTLTASNVFYNKHWGCPDGGEPVFILSGVRNIEFTPDEILCLTVWKAFAKSLKNHFKQTTVTLEVLPCELNYFKS